MHSITYIAVIISVLVLVPLNARSIDPENPGAAGKNLTPLIPGTDKPYEYMCGPDTAYRYNEYIIYTIPSEQVTGESISVYKNDKKLRDPCKVKGQEHILILDNEIMGSANFFAGLYLDYLFIDQGTGPTYRGLSIYDLKNGKLLYFTNYTDPVLSDGTLTYFETIHPSEFFNAKNSCIHVGNWSKQGLSTHYQRQATYNLETGKKESLDKYRCYPGQ